MSVRSAQSITTLFSTSSFSTGALVNADSLPTGTLYVNGVANAATVTVANVSTGKYTAAVTLPTLAVGDLVAIWIAATVGGVAGGGKVWEDAKDVLLDASGNVTFNNTSIATAVSVTNGVTVATNNDKAGYSISGVITTLDALAAHGDLAWPTATGFALASVWTSTRAGYVDNLNVGGSVASHADAVSLSAQIGSPMQVGGSVTVGAGGITSASFAAGAITDAAIAFPSQTPGRPTTFLAAMRRLWEWSCNLRTRNRSTGVVTLYETDGTTTLETQTQSTTGSVDQETQGA